MGIGRGFGVAGALDRSIVARLAAAAEEARYRTFWANDTPGGDGLEALAAAATAAPAIRLGVGVIPVDRRPAAEIIARVAELGLPTERLAVGIGSGGAVAGSLARTREAAQLLHEAGITVYVGALGPKMVALGGEAADGVVLNWLTPAEASRSAAIARGAASAAGRARTEIVAYVRTALETGRSRLEAEAGRYASYPQYAAHFARMGVQAVETGVIGEGAALQAGLAQFDAAVDETVVRAITPGETLADYLDLLHAAAPPRGA